MKFHPSLVKAVIDTLQRIFVEGIYADKAIGQVLKLNPKWGSRDRRFIAETTYEMVRWWRYISSCLAHTPSDSESHYYQLFATWQIIKGQDIPAWDEFLEVDKKVVLEKMNLVKPIRKLRESIPDWLDELGERELGASVWEREVHELNKPAQVVLRVNTLKISKDALLDKFEKQQVSTFAITAISKAWAEDTKEAILVNRQNLNHLQEYKSGFFEVQDASSQLIAPFLQLEEGMTVIDACAGAGGKSLHMAAKMNNKGKIIAMDVEERKLKELQKRANRAGVSIIKTQVIEEHTLAHFKNSADRILLDVPCSGLGVLKRNPDTKWKLSADFIEQIKSTQQKIIADYSCMLKPGGLMVYATCSILPGENEKQVAQFLKSRKGEFELVKERKVLPSEGFDGFYMAAIRKNAS